MPNGTLASSPRRRLRSFTIASLLSLASLAALAAGCSASTSSVGSTDERSTAGQGLDVLAIGCTDAPGDVYVTPGSLLAFTPDQRGNVIRCAPAAVLSASDLDAAARA